MQMGMVTHDSTVDIITSFAASPVSLLAIDTNIIVLFAIGIAESATRFSRMGSISIKVTWCRCAVFGGICVLISGNYVLWFVPYR